MIDIRDHGAIGDGIADDTAAIQGVLDGLAVRQESQSVLLPVGIYRTTAPLIYRGTYSNAIRLMGEVASAGPSGSVLRYDGPDGGAAVLEFSGGADLVVENLSLDCGLATYGIYAHYDPGSETGLTDLLLERLTVNLGARPGTACISLNVDPAGTFSNGQCDDVAIRSCKFVGGERCITTAMSNCKNFYVVNSVLSYAAVGLQFGGSGVCVLRDCVFWGNSRADVQAQIANLLLDSCESEASRMLLYSPGAILAPGNATVRNCSWSGTAGPDDVVIAYQGKLRLEDNQFWNGRTATSVPRVRLIFDLAMPSALISEFNTFTGAAADYTNGYGNPLFLDAANNDLMSQAHHPKRANWLRCFSDQGGTAGALVRMAAR